MSADQILKDISSSLQSKPEASQIQVSPKKEVSAVDFSEALLKLPEVLQRLVELSTEKKRELDLISVFERIDFDVKALAVKTDQNLTQISAVEKRLSARLKSLDLLEAKWQQLIGRVNSVLDELERVLRHS